MPVADFEAWRAACSVSRDAIERELGLPRECQDLNVAATLRVLAGPVGGERPARFAALLAQVDDAFGAWQGDDGANRVGDGERWETRLESAWNVDEFNEDDATTAERWLEFRQTRWVRERWHETIATAISLAAGDGPVVVEHADPEIAAELSRMATEMRDAAFAVLTSSPKIPYTNDGIAMFAGAVGDALEERGIAATVSAVPDVATRRVALHVTAAGAVDGVTLRGTIDV